MFKEAINLSKFLARYLNLTGANLNQLTHEDVKELFPSLKRSSYKEINEHPELLALGDVILVYDGKKTIPYYAPEMTFAYDEDGNVIENEPEEIDISFLPKFEKNDKHYDYMSLSERELRSLLVRKFNSPRNQFAARRELTRRGIPITLKYKRETNKNYTEEGD